METIQLEKDIKVMCVTATSFPAGIMAAHQKMHSLTPHSTERKYFGLSRPESGNGEIIYKAAAEQLEPGEAEKLNLETIDIKKGNYVSVTLHNFMDDPSAIGATFQQMIARPDIDPQGYCVEWYLTDKDVQCMVRLQD
ncbi:transcriptional regulator [Mucilaginibacter calamicampi]|uniref:Transcriptional regulator n=1 Tax=Mucilaginibacter calamicampi TaxID=1302352 RepID=A0ABW2YYD5_9SPHI